MRSQKAVFGNCKVSSVLGRDAFPLVASLICTLFVFEEVGVYAICGRSGRQ